MLGRDSRFVRPLRLLAVALGVNEAMLGGTELYINAFLLISTVEV